MLFFDLDGTLLDSNGIWLDIDIEFLGRHGIAPVPEDYTEYVTHHSPLDAARYTRTRFGLSETAEEIRQTWLQMARAAYAGKLELKPGARALLERCRRRGWDMAVLTSCMPELCRAALERHGIADWFRGVVTTQETGLEKRDPALYRLAAAQWGVPPKDCVLFEDSPGYCAAAGEAGFYGSPVRRPGGGAAPPVRQLGGQPGAAPSGVGGAPVFRDIKRPGTEAQMNFHPRLAPLKTGKLCPSGSLTMCFVHQRSNRSGRGRSRPCGGRGPRLPPRWCGRASGWPVRRTPRWDNW